MYRAWCIYADDGVVHCQTEQQAESILFELKQRFEQCRLELHPEKTKIIYCKDSDRKSNYQNTSFEFLGYCFRQRTSKNSQNNKLFINFTPGVSKSAIKSMRTTIRRKGLRNKTDMSLEEIAKLYNPIIRGWIEYYGSYNRWALSPVFRHFNTTLIAWARKKFKKLRTSKRKAATFMKNISKRQPELFAHWQIGMIDMFA